MDFTVHILHSTLSIEIAYYLYYYFPTNSTYTNTTTAKDITLRTDCTYRVQRDSVRVTFSNAMRSQNGFAACAAWPGACGCAVPHRDRGVYLWEDAWRSGARGVVSRVEGDPGDGATATANATAIATAMRPLVTVAEQRPLVLCLHPDADLRGLGRGGWSAWRRR